MCTLNTSDLPQSSRSNWGDYRYERMTDDGDITIMLFFRPGCPHCDNMQDDWGKLKQSGLPSNYKFVDVDTTLDKNKSLASEYGVSGVPHIVKSLSNGYYKVYSGNRSVQPMKNWILNK
mgnify:CR=1 FL=1|jgi:thioredoxin-related protein